MLQDEQLKAFFSRCYCVTLSFRPDRWERMERDVIPSWPLAPIEKFNAVAGKFCRPPQWWKAGPGAWGIYRSISRILEICLNSQVPSVLILEDDAIPVDNFRQECAKFLEAVPPDWGMVYLGGQHLFQRKHPPEPVNDLVYRAYNLNRCHAMAISQRAMVPIYQWLHRREWKWHNGDKPGKMHQDHIDHHLGRLHMQGKIPVYAPKTWLIGQAEGESNICGKTLDRRFWKGADMSNGQQVVAVVGTYRGGTSCVAGMLHHLGASMGKKFFQGREVDSPKGCFEALPLYQLCMRAYGEPNFKRLNTVKDQVRELREWQDGRWQHGPIVGAKHPKFCFMVPAMVKAWPTVKLVVVNRPIEESVKSLVKAGWWHAGNPKKGEEWAESLFRRMYETRDKDLENVPADRIMRLEFHDVIKDPEVTAKRLAEFAGLSPTPEQFARAISHVDDNCYRNRSEEPAAA